VHSELDIKDENPMYESNTTNHYEQISYGPANSQQNYYYVMPQNSGIVTQGAIIQGIAPQAPHAAYYMQQPYIMQSPRGKYLSAQQQQPVYQQQGPPMMVQPYVNNANYITYATQPQTEYMIAPGPMTNQPNPQNPGHRVPRPQNRYNQNNKHATPRQNSQHLNGATIRNNSTPVRGNSQRPVNSKKGDVPLSRARRKISQPSSTENSGQKVTSLIVLSDSDDEIEMIIMEKNPTNTTEKTIPTRARSSESQKIANQSKQKPTITSDITVPSTKSILSPQIIQRMSQGGISITPVKNNPPPTNTNTQLVVVVNETGSHYALALPNGSKLILTPEQVAQIRASNGGKLIL